MKTSIWLIICSQLFLSSVYSQADSSATFGGLRYSTIISVTPDILEKEWIYAAGDGENTIVYLNRNRIIKEQEGKDPYYKIWAKVLYKKTTIDSKEYRDIYSLERILINCKTQKYRPSNINYYDGKNYELIKTIDLDESSKWTEPIINTIGDDILITGCKLISNYIKQNPKQ